MHQFTTRRKCVYPAALQNHHWRMIMPTIMLGFSAFADNSPGPQVGTQPRDPGVRSGTTDAGNAIPGLSMNELTVFNSSRITFQEVDGTAQGLGPRFNLDSCSGCHAQPAVGGSSPAINPQISVASAAGARNTIPSFITPSGPVREVRFKRNPDGTPDGGVKGLFTIRGRSDARGCNLTQPDFSDTSNMAFRIPTPLFGAGLIEAIPDSTLRANLASNASQKTSFGISGKLNTSGNDGTVARFGWKAQNKSLAIFSGEAYNVEQGVSNELFPNKRDETPSCQYVASPNDQMDFVTGEVGDVMQFAIFGRFLDAPKPAPPSQSTTNGGAVFASIGCALCHTPTLTTGSSRTTALSNQAANLYSDLAVHSMGSGLADDIVQGNATGDEFRTAPLWGVGQRLFFLHDGRTSDLVRAITEHSSPGSEANQSIQRYNQLSPSQAQDLLNFLRSL
jgi:CxxC motif-containing protein (DUF1111 family)